MRGRLLILLASLLAAVLAACGGQSRTETATGAGDPAAGKPVVTVFTTPT